MVAGEAVGIGVLDGLGSQCVRIRSHGGGDCVLAQSTAVTAS